MGQVQDACGVEQMIPQVSHSDHWQEVTAVLAPPAASRRAWSLRRRRVSRLRASFLTDELLFMAAPFEAGGYERNSELCMGVSSPGAFPRPEPHPCPLSHRPPTYRERGTRLRRW